MELKDLSSTLSQVMDEETIEEENNHQYGHIVSSTYMYTSNWGEPERAPHLSVSWKVRIRLFVYIRIT